MYLAYNLELGWYTPIGTYSSDWRKAKPMLRDDVEKLCKRHLISHESQFAVVPVPRDLLVEILN